MQTVSSKNSRNNDEDNPESISSVSMPINQCPEDEFSDERNAKCGRQQRMEQRQEQAKKKLKLRRSLNWSLNERS